jgi:hypothetical protein
MREISNNNEDDEKVACFFTLKMFGITTIYNVLRNMMHGKH